MPRPLARQAAGRHACWVLGFWLLVGALRAPAATPSAPAPAWDTYSDTWVATDALGRTLPGADECGAPRAKTVGIFYFLWLTGRGPVLDLHQMLAADPDHPAFGPRNAFHFWSEPLLGYYRSDDPFVIRKHAQMLSDAGVDVLFFDVTNAFLYEDTCLAVCRGLDERLRLGLKTPRIAFFAHARSETVVRQLSQKFYAKGLHRDLWFDWLGKPLLIAPAKGLDASITNFFTRRESWAWTDPRGWFQDGHDKWPWLDHTPQKFGWHLSPQVPEEICVAVAEHPVANIGRSFHDGHEPAPGQRATERGLYFAEQWARALQVNPELVWVTGWNEWVAQRFISDKGGQSFLGRPLPPGGTFFVDTYNQEFSRDIEPMKGGHGDNYYYQLAGNIRRYKGVRPLPAVISAPIRIDGDFADWRGVTPEFRDDLGDPVERDHAGWEGQPRFVNHTGRNDLVAAKASWDATNVYFYARCQKPLSAHTNANWMLLFLDTDHDARTGWLGYDFVVNRTGVRAERTTVERHSGDGYRWGQPLEVTYRYSGNEIEVALPRAALGLTGTAAKVNFKWADNLQQTGEASDFTLNGDAAPNDRFNYSARFGAASLGAGER
jgi:hypothetical protein